MVGVDAWLARSQSLFADLGDAGLPAGLGEQLKVLRLLQLLEEGGAAPQSPDELTRWLAPVLCSRSDQVEPLRHLLASHFPASARERLMAARPVAGAQRATAAVEQRRFSLFWPPVLLTTAASVGAAGVAAFFLLRDRFNALSSGTGATPDIPVGPAGNVPVSSLVQSGIVVACLLAAAVFLIWRRVRLALHHGQVTGQGQAQTVRVDQPAEDQDNPQLLRAARMLNRPKRRRTGRLDVDRTVQATAQAGGRFSPVELIRRVPANWLLLVERGGAQDPLPEFGARLSKLLARSGVRHTLYEFRRSPDWVMRKERRDGPHGVHMRLERALADDRPTRVLMLAEASRVVDEETGGPARWLTDNDVPSEIVLLTPNPRENWSARESSAAQAGVLVLPAEANGLSTLARRMQSDELEPTLFAPTGESQFDLWQEERFTWLSQAVPGRPVRDNLIATLRTLLRKDAFRLLVGIAAFPQVRLDLMATLDSKLHPHDMPDAQRTRLLTLGRLVWVKEGVIPDWLRDDLMRALPAAELREIREHWMELLADKPAPGKPGSALMIHLAKGSTKAGAQGDGLFLGFMRGEYDLPAPLRFVRLAAGLWRAPDWTEIIVAAAAVAITLLAFLVDLNLRARAEIGLRAWLDAIKGIQDAASLPRPVLLTFAFLPAIAAQFWFVAALFLPIRPKHAALPATALTLLVLSTVTGGWLLADTNSWGIFKVPALDFTAPLVVAAGIVLLMLWPLRAREVAAVDLRIVIQQSRGTGLSDRPTLLALLCLFLAGVVNNVILPLPVGFRWLAGAWLIAIAVLGFVRAALISLSNARLQVAPSRLAGATRDAVIGLVLGQAWGAALAWMLVSNLPGGLSSESSQFGSWYINNGLMLFGAALGVAAALWPRGLISNASLYRCGAVALLAHAAQATGLMLLEVRPDVGSLQDLAFAVVPASVVALLAFGNVAQTKGPWRPFAIAVLILSLPSCVFLAMSWLGLSWPGSSDWALALPLVAATAATWPLVQRALTDEPSVAGEPAGWRPRPVAPELWVLAPLVLLTVLQIPIGPVTLDLPSLVLPLAIFLGWCFGLRGFRTAALLVLPALWFFVPVMLSGVYFAPFRALLPDASQFVVPEWIVPVTLDVAATALLAGALFARPGLFPQIRTVSRLPWLAIGVLAIALSLQVTPGAQSPRQVPQIGSQQSADAEHGRLMQTRAQLDAELKQAQLQLVRINQEIAQWQDDADKKGGGTAQSGGGDLISAQLERQRARYRATIEQVEPQLAAVDVELKKLGPPPTGGGNKEPTSQAAGGKAPEEGGGSTLDRQLRDLRFGPGTRATDQQRPMSGTVSEEAAPGVPPPPNVAQQAPSSTNQPNLGVGQNTIPPSGGGNYPAESSVAQKGWVPAFFLVLAMFLLAATGLGRQAVVIAACVALAGLASLALTLAGLRTGPVLPLPATAALAGLVAFAIGRYHERICRARDPATGEPSALMRIFVPPVANLLAGAAALACVFTPLLPGGDDGTAFLALASVLGWTIGVRSGGTRVTEITDPSVFATITFFGIATPFLLPNLPLGGLLGLVFALLLPAAAFLLGRRCRDAVMVPATAAAGISMPPQAQRAERGFVESITRWSGTSLEWFARLREDARERAAAGRQLIERMSNALAKFGEDKTEQPATEPPQAPPTEEQPMPAAPREPSGLLDALARLLPAPWANWLRNRFGTVDRAAQGAALKGQAQPPDAAPAETLAAEQPYLLTTRPDSENDWCFIVGIAHYVRMPGLPGASNGAAAFRDWAVLLDGGGVPDGQVTMVGSGDGSPSVSDLEERLRRFVQEAAATREHRRTPRRLYLYAAGYVFAEDGLVTPDMGVRDSEDWLVSTKRWADTICQEGLFSEVLLLVDGWVMVDDDAPSRAQPVRAPPPEARPKSRLFYALAVEPERRMIGHESAGLSLFSRALLEGLYGAATDTSSRVTGSSLRSYLPQRMETLAREEGLTLPPPVFYSDPSADITIVGRVVAPPA